MFNTNFLTFSSLQVLLYELFFLHLKANEELTTKIGFNFQEN